ncbi:MAG: ATP-dependent zinc metalloprotease FtsH [Flavonifractor plautii]
MFPIKEERDLNSNQNNNRGKGGGNKRNMTAIVSILLWALVLTLLVNLATSRLQQANSVEVSYGQFRQLIMQDAVESVVMASGKYTFTLKEGYSLSVGEDGEVTVRTPEEGGQDSQAAQAPQESGTTGGVLDLPLLDGTAPQQQPVQSQNQAQSAGGRESLVYFCAPLTDDIPELVALMEAHGITNFGPEYVEPINPILSVLLSWVLPMVLIMVVFSLLMRGMAGKMGGGIGNLGKSNAKVYVERKTGVTFKDVAGQDEAKESLVEIIDFLHNPQKYTEIGAKLPKGALLVGPPGTGKTLLAKAVAGEAGVHFLSISGSDFVELYVGVGASRVRDLFDQAKKNAPAIVFIDEIDAVGRQRGAGLGGGHDEREQTLNQLLVEMDGFGNNEGVVVMAATNRQDILDPALLRPGRFDRQVYVGHPDIKGREAILKVHARNKPLGDDVSLAELAKGTGGFTGADLENLMNEAALLAARRHHRFISMAELNEAVIKVIAGPEKKSRVVIERERKLTAYHEAGHAIVIHDLPTQDPVHEITIIPRGMAGGMTISLPQEDVTFQTRQQLTERIAVCLGGRAAEQLALGDISTGAGNDLQKASAIARNMVTRYGMSEKVGNVVFDSGHDEVFIGRSMAQTKNYSEEVAALIDEEIKALVDGAYARCGEILTHRRRELDIVAEYLLQYENMDAKTFEQVFTDPAALQPPAAYQAVEAEAEQDAREEEEHGAD